MQILKNIFILSILFTSICCELDTVAPKVTLPHGGVLTGSFMRAVNGSLIRAFRGIPYAEPPVGELRFRPPVPIKSWLGEKLTDKDGAKCISQELFIRKFETEGEEDCLYLNVYAPKITEDQKPLSVMIFIHGGGFMTGSGDSQLYGPEKFLNHDIILVTGNYRLGAFGFLSTGTEVCPGNNGLKDQVEILKWVQENIAAFGGNPKDVTIFGESAGAASVGHHIYSPLSKGLFHKAILQSATNFGLWAVGNKNQVLERTSKLGEIVGCPVDDQDWKSFIDCLRTKSANDIASVVKQFLKFDIDPAVIFNPVVEPEHEGAFITKHPFEVDLPPSGHVPIITGITSDDGLFRSAPIIHLIKDEFTNNFKSALPIVLYYDRASNDIQEKITEQIDEFYFKGKHDWSKKEHHSLTNVFTDNYFTWGQDKFLRQRFASAENNSIGPTYVYVYDHRGPQSATKFFIGGPEYYGVCHGDELPYQFNMNIMNAQGNSNDDIMKWALPFMWTNFAKTGNPTPEASGIPKWVPANTFPLHYARLGRQTDENWTILTNEEGLFDDRVQFWRSLEKMLYDSMIN